MEALSCSGPLRCVRRIAKGSRLRLFLRCPNSIGLEKSYNSGGEVESESGKDARTAHATVHHDAQHESLSRNTCRESKVESALAGNVFPFRTEGGTVAAWRRNESSPAFQGRVTEHSNSGVVSATPDPMNSRHNRRASVLGSRRKSASD
jgi:hypothetical protein